MFWEVLPWFLFLGTGIACVMMVLSLISAQAELGKHIEEKQKLLDSQRETGKRREVKHNERMDD